MFSPLLRPGTLALVSLLALPAARAQQNLESAYRTTGPAVVAAFEDVRKVLQNSSAVLLDGRERLAFGTVVSPEGHILTKASEIEGIDPLTVTVDRRSYPNAQVLATDPEWDLALVKIEAQDLVPVVFAEGDIPPHGTWVAANGVTTRTNRRLLAGVISAKTREIPLEGGAALGVVMKADATELEIGEVYENSGAARAGLKPGDVILAIDGKAVSSLEEVVEAIKDRPGGSRVNLRIRSGEEEKDIEVTLLARGEIFSEMMNRNDQMSGEFSRRRSGFPRVLQHDILGSRSTQGGPLLDLDGRCVGLNIARANRAESFAIPAADLRAILARLMSGENPAAPSPAADPPAEAPRETTPAEPPPAEADVEIS
jgi:serine protease Do